MGLKINGSTSGSIEIDVPAVAGTDTSITIPAKNGGTFIVEESTGNIDLGPLDINGSASDDSVNIDSSGRLLVGTSSHRSGWNNSTINGNIFQVERSGDTSSGGISVCTNGGTTSASLTASFLNLGKSRGTANGSNTVVASGDCLGRISYQGADGSEQVEAAKIEAYVDGTPGSNDMPGRLVFSTTADGASSPTERMRITEKGSLLVSSTGAYLSSTASYHYLAHNTASDNVVYVRHLASSGTAHGMVLQLDNGANDTTSYHLRNYVGGTLRSAFYSNGGLANVSANNANLSDRNAKKDIAPAAGTWDCLKEWEIVNYRYKDQPDDASLNMGVIAQQVAESCPEVITVFEQATEDQPEKLGVKEQQMMWMAIKALQEAQTRIETLETANASLEARLTALEGGAS